MSKKLSTQEKARRLWVRALRSGKYRWGRKSLHPSESKFCCFGVLCEVAVQQGVIKAYDPDRGLLPRVVREWAGLTSGYGDFHATRGELDTLVSLNDESKRNPFAKIANMIERNHKGLFVEDAE